MNSLWDIRIFLGLVPKESPCICKTSCDKKETLENACWRKSSLGEYSKEFWKGSLNMKFLYISVLIRSLIAYSI
jgi:hypothetical protein